MKKLIITCVLLTSVSFAVSAQTTQAITAKEASTSQTHYATTPEHKLTTDELKASNMKAEKSAKSLMTKLELPKEMYADVYASECKYQNYLDRFPDGKVPAGTMSNVTSGRSKRMEAMLTQAQFQKFQVIAKQSANK